MGGGSVEEWTLDRWIRKVAFRFVGHFYFNDNQGVLVLLGGHRFDQLL